MGKTGLSYNHADHSGDGVSCRNCHTEHTGGTGMVSLSNCKRCHKDPGMLEKVSDVESLHTTHIEKHKTECYYCHTEIFHTVSRSNFSEQSSCNQCHGGTQHNASEQMYSGRGGKGVEEMPAMKYTLGIDCNACHRHSETGGSMKSTSASEGCIACHGEDAASYLQDWENEIGTASKELAVLITTAQRSVPKNSEGSKYLDEAQYNLDFVEKARGVHNPEYALKLIEYGKSAVARAQGSVPVVVK